ncbi:hypothetical protein [Nostoc sp.]|uniref:hypothetical protein n=1 Tax=Nostoc sp. TaxID=1180 RepID=UPI002FF6E5AB
MWRCRQLVLAVGAMSTMVTERLVSISALLDATAVEVCRSAGYDALLRDALASLLPRRGTNTRSKRWRSLSKSCHAAGFTQLYQTLLRSLSASQLIKQE